MLGHRATNSLATRIRSDHESRIRDVRPASRLVRPQNISADNVSPAFCNVSPCIRLEPIFHGIVARHSRIESIRVPGSHHLAKNIPDRVPIPGSCFAYLNHELDALASFRDRAFPRTHVLATHRRCRYPANHLATGELRRTNSASKRDNSCPSGIDLKIESRVFESHFV